MCIDSGSVDDVVEEMVIRDRRHLSEDGIVLPIIAINRQTGRMESLPEIVSRGFALAEEGSEFMQAARQVVARTLEASNREEKTDWGVIKEKDPRGFEAVHREGNFAAAADHAGDFGGVRRSMGQHPAGRPPNIHVCTLPSRKRQFDPERGPLPDPPLDLGPARGSVALAGRVAKLYRFL